MLRKYQADSQQVLDDLFNERLIPFKLVAQTVAQEIPGKFRIRFYDSRLHSVVVEGKRNHSIKDQVRAAVLLRLSGGRDPEELGVSRLRTATGEV
jgi:hypothetical protein